MASCFVFLLAVLAPPYLRSEASVGAIEERNPNDRDVLDTLDFAMNELNAMQNNLYRMMATKVKDATSQVVKIRLIAVYVYVYIYIYLVLSF